MVTVLAACRGPALAPAPGALPAAEPTVRVGVAVEAAGVEAGSDGEWQVVSAAGETLRRLGSRERLTFRAGPDGSLYWRHADGAESGPLEGPLLMRSGEGALLTLGGRAYRGAVLVRAAGPGRVTAANVVELEDYLLGVVPAEIPTGAPEAVRAQTVAARTYAIGHLGRREALGFDFFATVEDQVYGGVAREDSAASRAVRETRGEVLVHNGRPILAFYHSTCGGRTAAVEEVWPRTPVPYLESVSDAVPGTDRYYCDTSSRFRWSVRWSPAQLHAILARTLVTHAGATPDGAKSVTSLTLSGRTKSGRAAVLEIVAGGQKYVIRGDSIRWLLRPDSARLLNSTLFSLEGDVSGGDSVLEAKGGGWGHGVGMCQVGAIGRARAGQHYREILSAYYRDAKLVRLYQ